MTTVSLPKTNKYGFYEIRMESIGGMGANLAGKILSEAVILGMGFNGASFASYGSEKKGTPVKANVRICPGDQEIRINEPVREPHLLVIFHEGVAKNVPVMAGVQDDAVIVINSTKDPDEVRDMLKVAGGTICCIDAIGISMEEKVKLNTVMLGAACKTMDFLDPKYIKNAIEHTIGKKYPKLLAPNLKAFDRGYNELNCKEFKPDGTYSVQPFAITKNVWGYENQATGGTIIEFGNSVQKDMSASREGIIPLFHPDRCTHCGQCETVCPDFCWVFEDGDDGKGGTKSFNKGVEYRYCKGCLRCVEACPVGKGDDTAKAITAEVESEHDVAALSVHHKEWNIQLGDAS